jgi:hypothetical protein
LGLLHPPRGKNFKASGGMFLYRVVFAHFECALYYSTIVTENSIKQTYKKYHSASLIKSSFLGSMAYYPAGNPLSSRIFHKTNTYQELPFLDKIQHPLADPIFSRTNLSSSQNYIAPYRFKY